jgi:hypothetical protein
MSSQRPEQRQSEPVARLIILGAGLLVLAFSIPALRQAATDFGSYSGSNSAVAHSVNRPNELPGSAAGSNLLTNSAPKAIARATTPKWSQ